MFFNEMRMLSCFVGLSGFIYHQVVSNVFRYTLPLGSNHFFFFSEIHLKTDTKTGRKNMRL